MRKKRFNDEHKKFDIKIIIRLLKYGLRYKWTLFFGLLAGLAIGGTVFGMLDSLTTAFEANTPQLSQAIVEEHATGTIDSILDFFGLEKSNPDGTMSLGFTLMLVFAIPFFLGLKGICMYVNRICITWVGGKVIVDLRDEVFTNLTRQSLRFFSKSDVGYLASRVLNDTGTIERMISSSFAELTRTPMEIAAIIGFIVYYALKLGMLSVVVLMAVGIPLIIIPMLVVAKKIKKYARQALNKNADLNSQMLETFSGIRVVKAYDMEYSEQERFKDNSLRCFKQQMKSIRAELIVSPTMELFGSIGMVSFLAYAYYNGMTFNQIAPFGAAAMMLYKPLKAMSKLVADMQRSFVGADRVFEYIDLPADLVELEGAEEINEFSDKIVFENVSFSYDKESPTVLSNINLEIKAGEMVAFVGETGSGKTTISNLLARFYDPTIGKITIDGKDLRNIKINSLRSLIGVVTQDAILFNNTIAYNIAYGSNNVSMEQITNAAKKANAHDFIDAEDDNYNRIVGEKGFRLSGGQKQRISIARAILKNPPILILDEATSALDTVTEKLVQEALNNLMGKRTVFAIAHRLSTIQHANKICVLEKGQIVEMGSHEELYQLDSKYRKLCDIQSSSIKNNINNV